MKIIRSVITCVILRLGEDHIKVVITCVILRLGEDHIKVAITCVILRLGEDHKVCNNLCNSKVGWRAC